MKFVFRDLAHYVYDTVTYFTANQSCVCLFYNQNLTCVISTAKLPHLLTFLDTEYISSVKFPNVC